MKKPVESEYSAQKAIFEWSKIMSRRYPDLRFLSGSMNGVKLTIGQARKAKAVGLVSGYPDIFLPCPRQGYSGLFIELKREKGGVLSADQKTWLFYLNDNGYKAVRCNGKEEAIKTILEYLGG